jgi:hypothetical protein
MIFPKYDNLKKIVLINGQEIVPLDSTKPMNMLPTYSSESGLGYIINGMFENNIMLSTKNKIFTITSILCFE